MNPRSLSPKLKTLGFKKPKQKRVDGVNKKVIPLNKEHLTNLFRKYGYDVTVATVVTDVTVSIQQNLTTPNTTTKNNYTQSTVTTVTKVTPLHSDYFILKTSIRVV